MLRKGNYRDVETFIVGKGSLPKKHREAYDWVTCAGGLGTSLLPAKCFDEMVTAMKPGGLAVFTVA